jgi:predicted RNA-binding Zn ribbon-like protein
MQPGGDQRAEAVELREAIDTVVRATVAADAVPPAALRLLNHWLTATADRPVQLRTERGVVLADAGPTRRRDARQSLVGIASDAAQVLGTDTRARARICPGPGCGGRFLDESPAGRRRWCSMAVCGNRHKAATHRTAARPGRDQ